MRRISPTLVAVFLGGVCVGNFGNQLLNVLRTPASPPADWPATRDAGGRATSTLEPGGAAFLADLRAQQGSVLAGTSLDASGAAEDRAEFAATLTDVQENLTEAEGRPGR